MCTIKGSEGEVADAEAQIRAIIQQRAEHDANQVEEQYPLERSKHKVIIGKGGATIKKIEAETGARLLIPKESPEDFITIRGEAAAVAAAKKMVKNEIEGEVNFKIPFEGHPMGVAGIMNLFLANKAAKLQALEQQLGAKIAINRDDKCITINGDTKPVLDTSMAINKLLAEVANKCVIKVDDVKKTGRVIGRGGEMVRKLQDDTGASIKVDKETSSVTIHGTVAQIAAAKAKVDALLSSDTIPVMLLKGEVQKTLSVPKAASGSIIGTKGASIREIQETSGAKVNLGDATDGMVACMVYGSPAAVTKACTMIEAKIAESAKAEEARNTRIAADANSQQKAAETFGSEAFAASAAAATTEDDGWGGGSSTGW